VLLAMDAVTIVGVVAGSLLWLGLMEAVRRRPFREEEVTGRIEPEGICPASRSLPDPATIVQDTAACPVCGGRFPMIEDPGVLPEHMAAS
jgi:hypothetical protein